MRIFKKIRITTEFNIVLIVFLTVMLVFQLILLSLIKMYTTERRSMNREIISNQVNSYINGKIETIERIKSEVKAEVIVPDILGRDDAVLRDEALKKYAKKLSEIQNYCPDTFYVVLKSADNKVENLMKNMSYVEGEYLKNAMAKESNVNGEIYLYEIEDAAYTDYRYIYTVIPIIGYDSDLYKTIDYGSIGICLKMNVRDVFSADRFSKQYENINININVNGEDINLIRSHGNNSHLIDIRGSYITNTNWEITGYVYDYTYNMLDRMRVLIYFCILLMLILILIFRKVIVKEIINPIASICAYLKSHGLNGEREALVMDSNKDINELAEEINNLYEQMRKDARKTFKNHQALYEKEILNVEMQLRLLQNQVNPHFIYNTFEIMHALALMYDVKEIEIIISALTKMLRYNLDSESKVSVRDEIEIILEYIEIMSIRYENSFSFEYVCDEDTQEESILKMICQPIIENCFIHGFKSDGSKLNIKMEIRSTDDKIIVAISDDGKGISPEKRDEILKLSETYSRSPGIGLSNLIYRLRLCYDNNFDFQILSDENVYTVINITVPKNEA